MDSAGCESVLSDWDDVVLVELRSEERASISCLGEWDGVHDGFVGDDFASLFWVSQLFFRGGRGSGLFSLLYQMTWRLG